MISKVSIVIPIYGVEKYIQKCVDSILNQTYSNLEIILVDDGSPDKCPKICDDYALLDNRVRVIHKENGGLSDARNAGMAEATGDYIVFIDGDDYAELNMVEKALFMALQNKSNVVIWGFYADYEDENEIVIKSNIHNHKPGVFCKGKFNNIAVSKGLIGNLGYAWNKMYDLNFLKMNNFKFTKGLSLVEDIFFNSPVLSLSETIIFLEEPLVHYMQRPRVTLGTKFYDDYYEIKLMGISAVEKLLRAWEQDNKLIEEIIATLSFGSLKTTIRLLSGANNLAKLKKRSYLKKILRYPETINLLKNVRPISLKDKILYRLIHLKQSYLLLNLYKLFQRWD